MSEHYVVLTEYATKRASQLDSLFRNTRTDGHFLYQFMDTNNWFNLPHRGNGLNAEIVLPAVFPPLDLWLKAYRHSDDEKYDLLLQNTPSDNILASHWHAYADRHPELSSRCRLDCLDYLASQPCMDPKDWNRAQMESFVGCAAKALSQVAARHMLAYVQECTELPAQDTHTYVLRKEGFERPTNALSEYDYAYLAWLVFDEEAVTEGHYIEKAAQSRSAAEMWLLIGLHFVCALRIPDLCRLPVPDISSEYSSLRNSVLNGTFSIRECTELVNSWLARIEIEGLKPNKTRRTKDVPPMSVSIPTSLFPQFGKMLALAASYHCPGEPLLSVRYVTRSAMKAFFGDEFPEHCGKSYFLSTRRLNKSYLQGVAHWADNTGHSHMQGYMIASMLRSHKFHYGRPSEVTDAYLQDGDFAGTAPETVAEEMFERGIFGFVPVLLLSQYDSDWHALSLHDQTTVIQSLQISAVEMERITMRLRQAEVAVRDILADGFRCATDKQGAAKALLNRITQGCAPGKGPENMCLRSAAGLPCTTPESNSCLTCPYALWTRVGIHVLMKEYERNLREMGTVVYVERVRLNKINVDFILPTLEEILVSVTAISRDPVVGKALSEMIQWRYEHAKNR